MDTLQTTVAAYDGVGSFRTEQRALARPATGEIRLRLLACGLCGTDLVKLRSNAVPPGTVLGHEVVGVVEETGAGVERVRTGDRVVVPHHVACGRCRVCTGLAESEPLCREFAPNLLTPGGFSTFLNARARIVRDALYQFPDGITDEDALFLEPAACVIRGLRRAGLQDQFPLRGQTVAILGGGSMGLLHLLVLRALDREVKIVVSEPIAERRNLALNLGADAAAPPGKDLEATVDRVSDGGGAGVVFDTVGGASRLDDALSVAGGGGTVVLFAHAPPGEVARFDLNRFFKREIRLVATYSSALSDQRMAHDLILTGRLMASSLITHRLSLHRAADALPLIAEGRALKIIIVPEAL